jgi:hypothetical protein
MCYAVRLQSDLLTTMHNKDAGFTGLDVNTNPDPMRSLEADCKEDYPP